MTSGGSALHEVLARLAEARSGILDANAAIARSRTRLTEAGAVLDQHLPQQEKSKLSLPFTVAESTLALVADRLDLAGTIVSGYAEAL